MLDVPEAPPKFLMWSAHRKGVIAICPEGEEYMMD